MAEPQAFTLTVPTNTSGEVHFESITGLARFANLNARRVSNTLEMLIKESGCDGQVLYALELLTDVSYQVAGAVEHLVGVIEAQADATTEAGHG